MCHATERLNAQKTGGWLLITTVIFMWDSKPKVLSPLHTFVVTPMNMCIHVHTSTHSGLHPTVQGSFEVEEAFIV